MFMLIIMFMGRTSVCPKSLKAPALKRCLSDQEYSNVHISFPLIPQTFSLITHPSLTFWGEELTHEERKRGCKYK